MAELIYKTDYVWYSGRLRFTSSGMAKLAALVDHGTILGLADNDHSGYLWLNGRAGGQIITAGTGAGDDLSFRTSSHATKGDYVFSEMTTAGYLKNTTAGVVTGGNAVDPTGVNHNGLSNLSTGDVHTQYALNQVTYAPASITATTGTPAEGSEVSDIQTAFDGNFYEVAEVTGTPGFEIEIAFSGVASFDLIVCRIAYDGAVTHWVGLEVYDYIAVGWKPVGLILHSSTYYQWYNFKIPPSANYVSTGAAKIRLYHYTAGNSAHDLYIDYAALLKTMR